jgi:hypothetical protein
MVSTLLADRDKIVSIDFIGSSLYALASMGDFQLRACLKCDPQFEFQLKASLQVISSSSILSFLTLFIGEFWHKDDNTVFSSGQWQLWKAILLAPSLQGVLWTFWWTNHKEDPFPFGSVLLIPTCYLGGAMWYILRGNAFGRTIRYGYLIVFAHRLGGFDYPKGDLLTQPTFSSLSGAKLSDMDQALTLATTIFVMMIQWKVWRRISSWLDKFSNWYKWKDEQGRYSLNIPLMAPVEGVIL